MNFAEARAYFSTMARVGDGYVLSSRGVNQLGAALDALAERVAGPEPTTKPIPSAEAVATEMVFAQPHTPHTRDALVCLVAEAIRLGEDRGLARAAAVNCATVRYVGRRAADPYPVDG